LVAVGLAGPIGPALMLSVMLVAILTVHKANGFFATANGIELPGLYLIGSVSVALAGPGGYSLDYILGLDSFFSQTATLIALGAGVFVAFGNLAVRDAPKTAVKA
jgi:putative oxidoreductase